MAEVGRAHVVLSFDYEEHFNTIARGAEARGMDIQRLECSQLSHFELIGAAFLKDTLEGVLSCQADEVIILHAFFQRIGKRFIEGFLVVHHHKMSSSSYRQLRRAFQSFEQILFVIERTIYERFAYQLVELAE